MSDWTLAMEGWIDGWTGRYLVGWIWAMEVIKKKELKKISSIMFAECVYNVRVSWS